MKNAFGKEIFSMKQILESPKIEGFIKKALGTIIEGLGIHDPQIIENVVELAKNEDLETYEEKAHELLGEAAKKIPQRLIERADVMYNQVKDHVQGTVLDLGCGDGRIGRLLADDGLDVTLTDVYKNKNIDDTGLPFIPFKQGEDVPVGEDKYDTTLLLTVMHHSDDPIKTLKEAKRATKKGGRIVVIESVYGVGPKGTEEGYEKDFVHLDGEEQRKANIFFDHVYNRIIHFSKNDKVNVPYNFNTPQGWREEAKKLGLEEELVDFNGIDLPLTVPEYHTLHVWRV